MPRLSIIIPHRNDDQRLEETILSVLENRPRDCEVIVVHDGSYRDPYELGDEVVYVQEEPNSTTVELLNAGLMAACSPVVCSLLDGVVVSANWAEPVLKRFVDASVAAVSTQLQVGRKVIAGVSTAVAKGSQSSVANLRSGRIDSSSASVAAPTLVAGFYRRKALLSLDGWNDEMDAGAADVELAFLFHELGMNCEYDSQVTLHASAECVPSRKSPIVLNQLAALASAHGLAAPSFGASITAIITGALTGSLQAAKAWSSGLSNTQLKQEISDRIAFASKQRDQVAESVSLKMYSSSENVARRKAA